MKKWIVFVLVAAVAGFAGYKMYNKKHTDTATAKADVVMSPQELLSAYESDENAANAKYLDKLVEVEGIITSVNAPEKGSSLTMDTGNPMAAIICEFESPEVTKTLKQGDKVRVKGYCTGKLDDIVLSRCSVVATGQ